MLCNLTRSASTLKRGSHRPKQSQREDSQEYHVEGTISVQDARPGLDEMKQRLSDLRKEIEEAKVDWYVVTSEDEHQSEGVANKDKRLEWISNFGGSAGTAIIPRSSSSKALLFVDSRYWIQAEGQVDPADWQVVRVGAGGASGAAGVSRGWTDWVIRDVEDGSRVGIDPKYISDAAAKALVSRLEESATSLIPLSDNLIDRIRSIPASPPSPMKHHPVEFSGESTVSKLARIRLALSARLHQSRTAAYSVANTEWIYILPWLPAIAWLLNERCESDIPFCPVGFAYLALTAERCVAFVDERKVQDEALKRDWKAAGVELRGYGIKEVGNFVKDFRAANDALAGEDKKEKQVRVSSSPSMNWALAKACEPITIIPCPVTSAMRIKNATEREGFRQAYLRDGRAYVRWMSWLENFILKDKRVVGEWAAVQTLTRFRRQEEHFAGLAYEDISAYGPHGAMAHYSAERGKDIPIGLDLPYVVDSGAQYLDGTIDTTRTLFFGDKPPDEIKRAYTRVLQGHLSAAIAKFPEGMDSNWLNMLARQPLFAERLEFGHGLGHGVGSYLGVHEYPGPFSHGFSFQPGHVTTIEPGYYKEGEYGMRIENLYLCKELEREGDGDGAGDEKRAGSAEKKWLGWERITQVPIQTSMIDWKVMSKDEIRWINTHNTEVQNALMPLLQGDEDGETRDWLKKACKPKTIWPWTGKS